MAGNENKKRVDRKKERIAYPKFWKSRGYHRRAVFWGCKDKKGKIYIKTSGGLRKADLMRNKRAKIASKKQHERGKRDFPKTLQPFFDAYIQKVQELGLQHRFVKAKKRGTPEEVQVYLAIREVKLKKADASQVQAERNIALARGSLGLSSSSTDTVGSSSATHMIIAPGDVVKVVNLTSEQGKPLNGCKGTMMSYNIVEKDRYAVKLMDPPKKGETIHVRPDCVKRDKKMRF